MEYSRKKYCRRDSDINETLVPMTNQIIKQSNVLVCVHTPYLGSLHLPVCDKTTEPRQAPIALLYSTAALKSEDKSRRPKWVGQGPPDPSIDTPRFCMSVYRHSKILYEGMPQLCYNL
jgi:hypothetical protein